MCQSGNNALTFRRAGSFKSVGFCVEAKITAQKLAATGLPFHQRESMNPCDCVIASPFCHSIEKKLSIFFSWIDNKNVASRLTRSSDRTRKKNLRAGSELYPFTLPIMMPAM
jgi:hypothetical protein